MFWNRDSSSVFVEAAVYTQLSYLPAAKLFSGLGVALPRKHFGGGMPLSGSPAPTKIKAPWEGAGEQLLFIPSPHGLGLLSWEESREGKKGVNWTHRLTQTRFVGDLDGVWHLLITSVWLWILGYLCYSAAQFLRRIYSFFWNERQPSPNC